MTSDKRRYFLHESGGVYWAARPDSEADYENDRTMTEVQVVPLDAIVIRRDELPEVNPGDGDSRPSSRPRIGADRGDILRRYITSRDSVESLRSKGAMYLALSEHLREHPPVDEAQVKALNDIYEDWSQPHNYGVSFGQYLVERGVRVEARPNEQG